MADLKKALMTIRSSNLKELYERTVKSGEPAYQSNFDAIRQFERGDTKRGDRLVQDMVHDIDNWIRAMEILKDESRKIIKSVR